MEVQGGRDRGNAQPLSLGLATSRGLPSAHLSMPLVRSYRTFAPLAVHHARRTSPWGHRRCVSVALSSRSPVLGVTHQAWPLGNPNFPQPAAALAPRLCCTDRDHLSNSSQAGAGLQEPLRLGRKRPNNLRTCSSRLRDPGLGRSKAAKPAANSSERRLLLAASPMKPCRRFERVCSV